MTPRFGCLRPQDNLHALAFPFVAELVPDGHCPLVMAIDWHEAFMHPVKKSDGTFWIGEDINKLGANLGGHAILVRDVDDSDLPTSYHFYNQGNTPHCVGFSSSHLMTLYNGELYDGDKLYAACKQVDGMPHQDGTTLRAAMDVLRKQGAWPKGSDSPVLADGIKENRWITKVDDIITATGIQDSVVLTNSWGEDYPEKVHLPLTTVDFFFRNLDKFYIEFVAVTDLPGNGPAPDPKPHRRRRRR